MFGDTQAGCQRIADAYNGLRARDIKPDRISEWFYGEGGELKGLVDQCRLTGVCDPELLFHVGGFRSVSLDGEGSEGVPCRLPREFRIASHNVLTWLATTRRFASNVRHYQRAVQRGCKCRFLKGFRTWQNILDKPLTRARIKRPAELNREGVVASLYRSRSNCVDEWGALEQRLARVTKDARLEPHQQPEIGRLKIDYLRAAITKNDMLSYPIYDGSRVASACLPIVSELELVGYGELRDLGVVRVIDTDPVPTDLFRQPARHRNVSCHTIAVQRYMRPNCGTRIGNPSPLGSSTPCGKTPGGCETKEWGGSPRFSSADPMSLDRPEGALGKLPPSG